MFCGECGAQNPDTNQFCKNCGKPLGRPQPAPRPAVIAAVPPPPEAAPFTPVPQAAATAAAPAAVPSRHWNWLGIVSIIPGILSWILMTGIFAIGAILLGIAGIVVFHRATGRIGISSLAGIILGIAAIAVRTLLP